MRASSPPWGNNYQGQNVLFSASGCTSGCTVVADPSDPAADVMGLFEPNSTCDWVYTPPSGSALIDMRGGAFKATHYNAPGNYSLSYFYNDRASR